jgi:hypothetical protein
MQRVNEFDLYELGKKIHPLTVQPDEQLKFSKVWYSWWEARMALDTILGLRPLSVAASAASRLRTLISNFVPEKLEDLAPLLPSDSNTEEPIVFWQTAQITDAAKEFETILAAECQVLDTYFISKKGTHSTKDLVENAHHQIPEPTRSLVPESTRNDFDQAGKCIAFDVPTAAAFHLLRGTEAIVRDYYHLQLPLSKAANPKMRNWGAYISTLKKYGADEKVTTLLTHIKDVYRNPVLHPEETYTDQDVQVLFGVCVSAVVLTQSAINALTAKGGLLQFSPSILAGTGILSE